MAGELVNRLSDPYLIVRADRGSDELTQALDAAGKKFHTAILYTSSDVEAVDPAVLKMMDDGLVDWVTMTSPAIARCVIRLCSASLQRARVICISQAVADVATEAGLSKVYVADEATFESMISRMAKVDAGPADG